MKEAVLEKIRNAGVVGAGGAGLPTHVKADAKVDTVLVNGASCEPLLMSDPYLLQYECPTVIKGLQALMACTGAKRGIICLKGKHPEAVKASQKAIQNADDPRLEIFILGDFYPAGDEHVLVREVLNRTVPERGIPLQVGAVVSNVESLFNVACSLDDKPVTHRYLTVAGEVQFPVIVKVPVGMRVADVLIFAGGPRIKDYKVVDGGPLMGRVLPNTDQPITKTTSGLLVLPPDHQVVSRKIMEPSQLRRLTSSMCCQCSFCTDMCPRHLLGHRLHPHKLMRISQDQVTTSEIAKEALLCSECGICEKFACPMLISPREVNAQIKQTLMKAGIKWDAAAKPLRENPFRTIRTVPTQRIVHRLNLDAYYALHPKFAGEVSASNVRIAMRQHIGAPARCLVHAGAKVQVGDLLGEIPENAMSARVHASINGIVDSVIDGTVTIRA